ncbi:hypothetical protein ACCS91_11760 [Rhizobium ruizarguesonis]|nr:hypothetical protein [Rhizobium ruizarguesonis]NEH30431.1 hypothetical protein [Rhizobium ruizarguesonis]NEK09338.1 hypothetical protein [Rhizobium ruizarguesonis]
MDILWKIQVGKHAPPPSELVWAVEMTKMPAPGSGNAGTVRFQKNERRMITCHPPGGGLGGWRPTPLALEIKAAVGRFRWREKIEKE